MNLFKKFFIISSFLFSVFIINVNAETYTLQYSQSSIDRYYQYEQLVNNAREYALSNNLIWESSIVYYNFSYISDNIIRVGYLWNDYNSSLRRFYTTNFDLTFDSNYNILSYTRGPDGYREEFIGTIIDTGYFDYTLGSTTSYTITLRSDNLIGSNGGLLIYANQPANFYDFVQALSFDLNPEPYQEWNYSNTQFITYKINDTDIGNNKKVNLSIEIDDNSIIRNDIKIFKYGSNIYSSYSFTCSNGSNNTICTLDLTYDVSDSIIDKIMFDIDLGNSYNVKIIDNSEFNQIFINRENIEYEYKSINFKELAGAVLYPRNYSLFNQIYNKNSDDFKFLFTNKIAHSYIFDSNYYKKSTTYDNDFDYQNTYLFLNDNNTYDYYYGQFIDLNNISYLKLLFNYDSSMLLDNHYPCFVLMNNNYLGTDDTDNKDLFLYYNSSLFSFSKLKNVIQNIDDQYVSTIVLDDSNTYYNFTDENNNYVSYNADPVYSVNKVTLNFNSELINTYNNLFEFFKDKIISFFELISLFFNSMPIKFQYAFSFVFVLVIALMVFKLLL